MVGRRGRLSWGTLCLAWLVLPAGGAAAAEDEAESEPEKKRRPNERVCHTVKVTGSHLPERVCLKQREWDRLREEAQRLLQDQQPVSEGTQDPA